MCVLRTANINNQSSVWHLPSGLRSRQMTAQLRG